MIVVPVLAHAALPERESRQGRQVPGGAAPPGEWRRAAGSANAAPFVLVVEEADAHHAPAAHDAVFRTTSRGRSRTGKRGKQLAGLQPVEASMANGFMSQAAGFNFCNLPH